MDFEQYMLEHVKDVQLNHEMQQKLDFIKSQYKEAFTKKDKLQKKKIQEASAKLSKLNFDIFKTQQNMYQIFEDNVQNQHSEYHKQRGDDLRKFMFKKFQDHFQQYFSKTLTTQKLDTFQLIKKLTTYSVAIKLILEDPTIKLPKSKIDDAMLKMVNYCKTTISINRNTTFNEIYEFCLKYWSLKREKYGLCDINYNDMQIVMNVPAQIFFAVEKDRMNHSMLYLIPYNYTQEKLIEQQQEACKLQPTKFDDQGNKIEQDKSAETDEEKVKKLMSFLTTYKMGLRNYRNSPNEIGMRQYPNIFYFLILILLNLITMFCKWSPSSKLQDWSQIYTIEQNFLKNYPQKIFQTKNEIYTYIEQRNFVNITQGEKYPKYEYMQHVGPFRWLFARTISDTSCQQKQDYEAVMRSCYYNEYTSSSKDKEPIIIDTLLTDTDIVNRRRQLETESELDSWRKFSQTNETLMTTYYGKRDTYDGSGYYVEFKAEQHPSDISKFIKDAKQVNLIDESLRAIIFDAFLFDVELQHMISFYEIIELTVEGLMFTTPAVKIYKPLILSDSNVIELLLFDTLAMVSLIGYFIFELYSEVKTRENKQYIYSFSNMFNFLLMILGIVSQFAITTKMKSLENFKKDVLNTTKFRSYIDDQTIIDTSLKVNMMIAILCSVRILQNMKLNNQIIFVMQVLRNSAQSLLMFLFFIIASIFAFSMCLNLTFGVYIYEFSNKLTSIQTFLNIFYLKDIYIGKLMYYYNPTVTTLLFMIGVPIFIYGVGIINIAIVMETSRIMSRQTWLYEEKNDIIESYKQLFWNSFRIPYKKQPYEYNEFD